MRTKCVFERQDLQMFGLKLDNMGNFHSLEDAGRGSETQLQVGEKINDLLSRLKDYDCHCEVRVIAIKIPKITICFFKNQIYLSY